MDLACRRGNRLLFQGLQLDVAAGQIVWLRGQNGCGKTSLLRLAAGLAEPERGQITSGGVPVRRCRDHAQHSVFVAHGNALKDDLSAGEALAFLLRVHGRRSDASSVRAALQRLGVESRRAAPVRTLSQGQRRRVALARLAVEDRPALWLLDEPFDALDRDGSERVTALLDEHLQRGGSVLFTSHISVDASRLQPVEVDLDRYT